MKWLRKLCVESRKQDGSAFTVVLMYAVIALIVSMAYIAGQMLIARPALIAPAQFQALLTARSGAWKALDVMNKKNQSDTLKRINTLDSAFGKQLFGTSGTSNTIARDSNSFDTSETNIQPFSTDTSGTCTVSLSYLGCFKLLRSKGLFRNYEKQVTVCLGGSCTLSPDTVCYLTAGGAPAPGTIDGKVTILSINPTGQSNIKTTGKVAVPIILPTGKSSAQTIVQDTAVNNIMARYRADIVDKGDTLVTNPPLLIQNNDDFARLPDVVNGPLFIDGSRTALSWHQQRRINVLGDIQITGNVTLSDIEFAAFDDIKILDECNAQNVTITSLKHITIGDRTIFSGNAVAQLNILVCGHAKVDKKSVLVVCGKTDSAKATNINTTQTPVFGITFTEWATIDAVVISLQKPLGIYVDKYAIVHGLLWTKGYAAIDGTVYGIVIADNFVNSTLVKNKAKDLEQAKNYFNGAIKKLPNFNSYRFPVFMGTMSICSWQEH